MPTTFDYFVLFLLKNLLVEPETVQGIIRLLGGSSSIYFIFLAKTLFSKRFTLFSFLVSTCYLFVLNHANVPDISLVPICICSSFIVSYYFISTDKYFDHCFLMIMTWKFFVLPDLWMISFVFELLILFSFHYRYMNEERKGLCFYLIILLLLFLCCNYYTGNLFNIDHLVVVLVLAAAGAGGIQFMFLSKTELGGLKLYLINNVILGFLLMKDNETLPLITICFLVSILCFCIALYLIGRIKEQSFYSVLSESKGMLHGVFIPVLVILNHLFLEGEYSLWITSLVTHIIVIQLLQFILKKEDEDPDQDKAIKSDDKGEGDQKGDKKAQSPLDQFSIGPFLPLKTGKMLFAAILSICASSSIAGIFFFGLFSIPALLLIFISFALLYHFLRFSKRNKSAMFLYVLIVISFSYLLRLNLYGITIPSFFYLSGPLVEQGWWLQPLAMMGGEGQNPHGDASSSSGSNSLAPETGDNGGPPPDFQEEKARLHSLVLEQFLHYFDRGKPSYQIDLSPERIELARPCVRDIISSLEIEESVSAYSHWRAHLQENPSTLYPLFKEYK